MEQKHRVNKTKEGLSLSVLVWLLLLSYQTCLLAGITGKIVGKVRNQETSEVLVGANIILAGTALGAVTDREGDYFILNVTPGEYTIKASILGFVGESKTGILVSADRTITVNFALKQALVEGEAVTVVANREIIAMDVSSSQVVATAKQVEQIPIIKDLNEYIGLQVGIEGEYIRGGGLDQTLFMVDGLLLVDSRANKPMYMVNLGSIKEITIIEGGFNPEYGNVRSGLINIVTKEGKRDQYNGAVDFRFSPARQKHYGQNLFDPQNFFLRSFLDPGVCYVGTANGSWSAEKQSQNIKFQGWNAVAAALVKAGRKITADDCRNLFMWRSRAWGSDALAPANYTELTGRDSHEKNYTGRPDWNADISFSGPVPFSGGRTSFFVSHRNNWEAWALPTITDYYKEQNSSVKLSTQLTSSMNLSVQGLYGQIKSATKGNGGGIDQYCTGGYQVLDPYLMSGEGLYWDEIRVPYDVYSHMIGVTFDHVLNPNTYYNLRITNTGRKNFANGPASWRDTTKVVQFGDKWYEDEPYGFKYNTGNLRMENEQAYSGAGAEARDHSSANSLNAKFDLTSQVNKYNQLKTGIEFNYDDIRLDYATLSLYSPNNGWYILSHRYPVRGGAYIQDKLEFEGMIANLGLRVDYNNPNCDWYTADPYSDYFNIPDKSLFEQQTPKTRAKGQFKLSPRLGISHPISANAKLYFSYGHFYSMPSSIEMFQIEYRPGTQIGIFQLGNPSANIPKTVAYELGLDYSLGDFYIHLAGYYKDVSDQTSWVSFVNTDHSVNYQTIRNQNYADIRGLELRIDRRFGRWITGWVNYNYMVQTNGYVGRNTYYQDYMDNMLYGLYNPNLEVPLARPYARANLVMASPGTFGPKIGRFYPLGDLQLSWLGKWKAGAYETWDPMMTLQLTQNLQWKDEYNLDLRVSKMVKAGRLGLQLFADIQNILDLKYLWDRSFYASDVTDRENYYKSLHLKMYDDPKYIAAGFTPGNDSPGDVKSQDKPYIDMPNIDFLWYRNLRTVTFGLKASF
jgi:outer membrane receptor for ferrienterochelin and colicin